MWYVWEQKHREFVGNPEVIRQLWRRKCRLESNIKVGLEETCWERLEWIHLAQGPVACFCEQGNEPFGSIKSSQLIYLLARVSLCPK
jgi:hypothetical protein